jgi:hypothetical protein
MLILCAYYRSGCVAIAYLMKVLSRWQGDRNKKSLGTAPRIDFAPIFGVVCPPTENYLNGVVRLICKVLSLHASNNNLEKVEVPKSRKSELALYRHQ